MVDSKSNSQTDRATKKKRENCERDKCGHLFALENTDCVNKCMSPSCYEKVFDKAETKLEDGEINNPLEKSFRTCMRREMSKPKKRS